MRSRLKITAQPQPFHYNMISVFASNFIKIFIDIILDIIYFPFWWYSAGFWFALKKVATFLSNQQKSLGIFIWLKNIFVPMYGQRNLSGFLISFFMRIIQIIFRSLIMIFYLLLSLVYLIIWLGLPIAVVWEIVYQLTPAF